MGLGAKPFTALVAGGALLAGCGSAGHAGAPAGRDSAGAATSATAPPLGPAAPAAPAAPGALPAPVTVALRLTLPHVGLSSAPTVSYATSTGRPFLKGAVSPATATVYEESPDGTRTAVNAGADGSFAVRAKLTPGPNLYRFTAAVLGTKSASRSLAVTWTGRAAAARRRAIAVDPAKYLPPASAGLNRKLASIPKLPKPGPVRTVTFSLSPINAAAPPAPGVPGGDGHWLGGFELTEYYPALESWFHGALVPTPGLPTRHRIDWLYSAHGLSMEGDGIGLDGRTYHIDNLGAGGWLTADGRGTAQFGAGGSSPFWRTGGFWRNQNGAFTIQLDDGSWSNGVGVRFVAPPAGISFAAGLSRPLAYLRSVAVDPSLIPLGSHIFIPAYQSINGGWFEADDTGGAIVGRHIDVYRPPPSNPNAGDPNGLLNGQQVYIVPPGRPIP